MNINVLTLSLKKVFLKLVIGGRTPKGYASLRLRQNVTLPYNMLRVAGKPKIFCIGANKTGTTSLKAALEELGIIVGNQRIAELLFDDWVRRDFRRLIRYCHTAQAFQDAPFSYADTFVALDQAFPGSKFILTVRDSSEQWYQSLTRFHSKLWGNGAIPTAEDLKNAEYLYKGFAYDTKKMVHRTPDNNIYDKETLIRFYETHNTTVINYFAYRRDDLLVINVAEKDSYQKLCQFLGVTPVRSDFPWENKT